VIPRAFVACADSARVTARRLDQFRRHATERAGKADRLTYSTTSPRLANDVQNLRSSSGGAHRWPDA